MTIPEHAYLAFGIPSLDRLFGHREGSEEYRDGLNLAPPPLEAGNTTPQQLMDASVCLIGPDGTGKSIFALHLASDHWHRCANWWKSSMSDIDRVAPKIIYASSDLSLSMARTMWKSFWLDRPFSRRGRLPFEGTAVPDRANWIRPEDPPAKLSTEEISELTNKDTVQLRDYKPSEKANLTDFLSSGEQLGSHAGKKSIAFIDLESDTSGDDWAFLNKLLHALPRPLPDDPLHMLVIDAVEGLETLVGNSDAFGHHQERRARIAQLVRAAAGKCHLVFVVEEPKDDERLPEVFVADIVVRLRATMDGDYSRRTVEVEKVRGQKHVRGQHDFRMRGPGADQRGEDPCPPDCPATGADGEFLSYVLVFPSLHQIARGPILISDSETLDSSKRRYGPFVGFGIYHLDTMLGNSSISHRLEDKPGTDERGLPAGTVTTIIGRESTYKSRLARSFLGMAFRTRYESADNTPRSEVNLRDPLLGQGVAVLLCTSHTSIKVVQDKIREHMIPETYSSSSTIQPKSTEWSGPNLEEGLTKRLIVRYLEPHHLTAAILIQMIQQLIIEAKRRLEKDRAFWANEVQKSSATERLDSPFGYRSKKLQSNPIEPFRIRFVIDDWALILSTFPEVRNNPKFLPTLIHYLKMERVSTLILANHQGSPNEELKDGVDPHFQELRSLSDQCLHTWQVSFFDERRVAITLLPQTSPGASQQVRELRPARLSELRGQRQAYQPEDVPAKAHPLLRRAQEQALYHSETLTVDPHFELYSGLERGSPNFIPLRVYLYAEKEDIPAFQSYLSEIKHLYTQIFGHGDGYTVLQPQYGPTYDALREFSYLQSETRLDHTLVLQVDEFWAESRSELLRMEEYLNARTVDYDDRPVLGEDPFGLFQLTEAMKRRRKTRDLFFQGEHDSANAEKHFHGPLRRRDFFDTTGYEVGKPDSIYPTYKIPYTWDFGFLVCDSIAWEKHAAVGDHRTERVQQLTAKVIPEALRNQLAVAKVSIQHRTNEELKGLEELYQLPSGIFRSGSYIDKTKRIGNIWDRLLKIEMITTNPIKPEQYEWRAEKYSVSKHSAYTWVQEKDYKSDAAKRSPVAFQVAFVRDKQENPSNPSLGAEVKGDKTETHDNIGTTIAKGVPQTKAKPDKNPIESVTWREFLGACATIARESNYTLIPFDVDMLAVESLSCLVFEVWMSEVEQAIHEVAKTKAELYQIGVYSVNANGLLSFAELELLNDILATLQNDNPQKNRFSPRKNRNDWTSYCLSRLLDVKADDPKKPLTHTALVENEIAKIYRRALYRTMILLGEVLDIERISDPSLNLKPRSSSANAVAARHWYSSATATMTGSECRGKVVAGLPGNYSVRGDWFLAVARGSRSPRLGERAMDILCSKRVNITRLQHGLGLPVRDLQGAGDAPHLQKRIEYWTSLPYVEIDGTRHNIEYKELRALGAQCTACEEPIKGSEDRDRSIPEAVGRNNFKWFWRSSIESYDAHARIWQRWLCLVLRNWKTEWRPLPTSPSDPSVTPYILDLVPEAARGKPWWDGFREYDHYRRVEMHPATGACCYVDESERYKKFTSMLDGFIETLERSSQRVQDNDVS